MGGGVLLSLVVLFATPVKVDASMTGYHTWYRPACQDCRVPYTASTCSWGQGIPSSRRGSVTCGADSNHRPDRWTGGGGGNAEYSTITYTCSVCGGTKVEETGRLIAGTYKWTENGRVKTSYCSGSTCGTTTTYSGNSNNGSHPAGYIQLDCRGHEVPNNYTVVYNPNGGSGSASSNCTYDSYFNLNDGSGFLKAGHHIIGWSWGSGENTKDFNLSQNTKNLTSEDGGTVTLYAVWEPDEYKVIYKSNAPWYSEVSSQYGLRRLQREYSGYMSDKVVTWGEGCTLDACNYFVVGYNFLGWSTSSDGSVVYVNEGTVAPRRENLILYAVWSPVNFSVNILVNKPNDSSGIIYYIK